MRRISTAIKNKIVYLRKRGRSISELSRTFGLSKSTVSLYITGVSILPSYQSRWLAQRSGGRVRSEREWSIARTKAARRITSITPEDLILIGAALYWAEGSKRDFGLSNTDPELIKIFLHILRKAFAVQNSDLKVSVRIYEDLNQRSCLRFWSRVTGVKLGKNTSVNILKGSKRGKLQYGMCRIRVRKGGPLLKEFFSIIRRVNELALSPYSSSG